MESYLFFLPVVDFLLSVARALKESSLSVVLILSYSCCIIAFHFNNFVASFSLASEWLP